MPYREARIGNEPGIKKLIIMICFGPPSVTNIITMTTPPQQ
jgi:hypothetical protein